MTGDTVSVVIVTWLRPDYVRACLAHLALQQPLPDEVVVVDASPDTRTAQMVAPYSWARRIPFPGGAGHMTTARNVGLREVSGDLVAFLDDDANPRAGWLAGLRDAFADTAVGAVAGRTCNGVPGEDAAGREPIGRVLPNGELTANFAAAPAAPVEVEHGIGANMAFRREILTHLGGFRDDFCGVGGVREDTDVFLRLRALGYRAIFAPAACVDHVGAPHAKGRRFDFRYQFWTRHNHALLLARNFGMGSHEFRSWLGRELRHPQLGHGSLARRGLRYGMALAAIGGGLVASLRKAGWRPVDAVRNDAVAVELRARLADVRRGPE